MAPRFQLKIYSVELKEFKGDNGKTQNNQRIAFVRPFFITPWGKSALGRASGQTLNDGLKLNYLYTNGVVLNLTYVA